MAALLVGSRGARKAKHFQCKSLFLHEGAGHVMVRSLADIAQLNLGRLLHSQAIIPRNPSEHWNGLNLADIETNHSPIYSLRGDPCCS